MPRYRPLEWEEVRYERNVELGLEPNCWEVTSHHSRVDGYPNWGPDAHDGFPLIHRWVYFNAHPEADESLCVLHHCDNKVCINPNHAFLGTRADNNRDKIAKGRDVTGPWMEAAHAARRGVSPSAESIAKGQATRKANWTPEKQASMEANLAKGRAASLQKRRQFTEEQIKEIRMLGEQGWVYSKIAEKFDCSRPMISYIVARRRYAHVE